jgi:tight adherence protein B
MPPLAAIVIFAAVFTASMGAALLLNRRARSREARVIARISPFDGARKQAERGNTRAAVLISPVTSEDTGLLKQMLRRTPAYAWIASMCERAGAAPDPMPVLRSCGIFACVAGALALALLPRTWFAAVAPVALLCGLCPLARLRMRVRKRLDLFEAQFSDGLEFIARSMRAGHAFSVSLEMLYREFDEPMAGEFRRTFEEQNLGLPLENALARFAHRVPLVDVRFFTSAVLLQRKTGGNLTEILDNLAHLIRERYKLRGKIRAISAHGRMTGKALTAIPIFVGALMLWMNRDYRAFFFSVTLGKEMLAGAAALQVIAYAVINRIVKIEV